MTAYVYDIIETPVEEEQEEPSTNHYVDRKEFYAAIKEYRSQFLEAKSKGESRPQISNYLAKCFLDIATHLGYRRNFANYSYRDEMVMDAVEVCLRYAHNFNPELSNHPFSYFNRLCWRAFVYRIQKEKDQQRVKGHLIMHYSMENIFEEDQDMDSEINNGVIEYLKENSFFEVEEPVTKKREKKYVRSGIDLFMEEEEE